MEKNKERNSEGKSAVMAVTIIIVNSIYAESPVVTNIIIGSLSIVYMAVRAYIKKTPSKTDDKMLANFDNMADKIVKKISELK